MSGISPAHIKAALIAFHNIPGSHTGEALGEVLFYLLSRANVVHNVSAWLHYGAHFDLV
jgi:hypothetical protein